MLQGLKGLPRSNTILVLLPGGGYQTNKAKNILRDIRQEDEMVWITQGGYYDGIVECQIESFSRECEVRYFEGTTEVRGA